MIEDWTGLAPRGVKARFYPYLDSTNLEGERLIKSAVAESFFSPLWIVTAHQTAGRGRLGREWSSLSGNLFCSLVIQPFWPLDQQNYLPFAIGLGLAATVTELINTSHSGDFNDVRLKWPNDVLIKGQKVAGILIERASPQGPLVIGIGLNLAKHPENTAYPATSLAEYLCLKSNLTVSPPSLDTSSLDTSSLDTSSLDQKPEAGGQDLLSIMNVFSILACQVKTYLEKLTVRHFCSGSSSGSSSGPCSDVLAEWVARASGFGERRLVTIKGVKTPATLVGLNDKGGLIVKLDDNQETILYAGDVFDLV